jgi:hypothetical protein
VHGADEHEGVNVGPVTKVPHLRQFVRWAIGRKNHDAKVARVGLLSEFVHKAVKDGAGNAVAKGIKAYPDRRGAAGAESSSGSVGPVSKFLDSLLNPCTRRFADDLRAVENV